MAEDGPKMTDGRGRTTEGRRQMTDHRLEMAEDREQITDNEIGSTIFPVRSSSCPAFCRFLCIFRVTFDDLPLKHIRKQEKNPASAGFQPALHPHLTTCLQSVQYNDAFAKLPFSPWNNLVTYSWDTFCHMRFSDTLPCKMHHSNSSKLHSRLTRLEASSPSISLFLSCGPSTVLSNPLYIQHKTHCQSRILEHKHKTSHYFTGQVFAPMDRDERLIWSVSE